MKQELKVALKKLLICAVYIASVLVIVTTAEQVAPSLGHVAGLIVFIAYTLALFLAPDEWVYKIFNWVDKE